MSGHSKWSSIKHKKARLDAKRGKNWGKLSRAVTLAAKTGGASPDDNPRLRLAIDKAKADNMPKDTIEKAIKKGTGELTGEDYEEVIYEGYAVNGVAVMARALTDNRNRTAGEIRKIFERAGGSLGATNCVAWMFSPKGVFIINASDAEEDRLFEVALENGAEDVSASSIIHEVICPLDAFGKIKSALEQAGIPIQSSDITSVASNSVTLDLAAARKVLGLMDSLDEHDDIESVSSNFDIPDDVMAELAK